MNTSESLNKIRGKLIRLEETIIFALIERSQFRCNRGIYGGESASPRTGGLCLLDYVLRETEKAHARAGRYAGHVEVPFFTDLPSAVTLIPHEEPVPVRINSVNLNGRLRAIYADEMIPYLCIPGDDGNHWESCLADASCLQALSRRIHYGKVVAEIKYREHREEYDPLLAAGDGGALMERITAPDVEARVLERIRIKANYYGQDPSRTLQDGCLDPELVVAAYRHWIIPLTKEVEIRYLFECAGKAAGTGSAP